MLNPSHIDGLIAARGLAMAVQTLHNIPLQVREQARLVQSLLPASHMDDALMEWACDLEGDNK